MRPIDADALKAKIEEMQAFEPKYAFHFLNDAQNPSTEWECVEDLLENAPTIETKPTRRGGETRLEKLSREVAEKLLAAYPNGTEFTAVRHGYWEPIGARLRGGITDTFQCSLCEYLARALKAGKECGYDFCPNCGAKMEEAQA